ncbi:hypothetical protein [Acidovorax sp. sif0715]
MLVRRIVMTACKQLGIAGVVIYGLCEIR